MEPLSGVVRKRDGGALMLDSGGPNLVPLRVPDSMRVTMNGQPGTASQIGEGDIVRAACRFDANGEAQAVMVVADSRPVSAQPATPAPGPQQRAPLPQARRPSSPPRR